MKTLSYEGKFCPPIKLLFSFLLIVSPSAFSQTWENLTHERQELPYQSNTDKTVLASGLTGPWSFSKNICGYDISYQLRKYANGIWVDKGTGVNLEFRNTYTDRYFTIDKKNDIPYIISGYPSANVLRFTESGGWQPVGNSNFTGPSLDPTITVDHNGVPYVGYIEGNHTAKVMKLNTSTNLWEEILSESYYPEVVLYSIVKTDTLGNVYTATMTEAGKSRISGQTMFETGGWAMDFDVCDDGAFSFGQDGNPLYFRSQPLTDGFGDPILCYGKSFFDHFRNTAFGAYTLDANDPRFANPQNYYKLNLHSKTDQGLGADTILSFHNGSNPNLGLSFDGKFSCFFWDVEFDYSNRVMPTRLVNRWWVAGEGADNPATWKKFLPSNSDLTSFHNKTAVVYSNESNFSKPTALVYENGIWQSLFLETIADSAKEVQAEYDPNGNLVVAIVNNKDSLILYTHATGGGWTEHGGPTRDQMRDPDRSPEALHCKVNFIALKLQPQTGIPYLFFADRCFGGQGSVMKYTGQWEFAGNRGLTIGTTGGGGYDGGHNRIDFLVETGQSIPVVIFTKPQDPENSPKSLCIRSLSTGNGDWVPFRGSEYILTASDIIDADIAIKDTLIYIVSSIYSGEPDFRYEMKTMTYNGSLLVGLNNYEIGIAPGAVALTIDSLNQPFIAFSSNSSCYSGSVIKLDQCTLSWKVVGQPNVIPPSNNVNLCILSNGNSIGSYDTRDDVVGVNFIQNVSGPQPSMPTLALGPDSNYFCLGDTVTLAIHQGDLNLATHWSWYKGSCGGELLGTGNSIRISPTDTTTYFVRGEGGAADRCGCTSVTMILNNQLHTYYQDADGDSFGNPAMDTLSCHSIPGYVLNHFDCNDANPQMHSSFLFFVDGDMDGYGSADTARVCAVNANTPPAGYSPNNTDCNDQLSSVHSSFLFYIDADHDGYGSANSELLCASGPNSAPSGYSANNTDCDDANALVHHTFGFYLDQDQDGFGAGVLQMVCAANAATAPSGFSLVNTDCNDGNSAVHPGATEIINGLDDNCNGFVDEGLGTPMTLSGSVVKTVCTGSSNGAIDLTVSGGQSPFTFTWSNGATTEDIASLAAGTYSVSVQDQTAATQTISFLVGTVVTTTKPGTPGLISGPAYVCLGSVQTYSVAPISNASSYNWSAPVGATILSGQGTKTILVSFGAGFVNSSLTVSASNCIGTSLNRTLALKTTPLLTPGTISGDPKICGGQIKNYSISPVANSAGYEWEVIGANLISGQSTNSISVEFPPVATACTLKVKAINACGLAGTVKLLVVLPFPLLSTGTITGNLAVCNGTPSQTYSVAAVPGASAYQWVVGSGTIQSGQGSNSILLDLPATFTTVDVQVRTLNACGIPGAFRKATIKTPAAPTPGLIGGPANEVCGGSNGIGYQINPVAGAVSYNWVISAGSISSGQGTPSVSVDFPTNYSSLILKVQSINQCGTPGSFRSMTIRSIPATPGVISGSGVVCSNSTNGYSVTPVNSATSYNWTLPAGWILASGSGANNISTTSGNSGGSLKVTASNACGISPTRSLAVTVQSCGTPFREAFGNDLETEELSVMAYPNPCTEPTLIVEMKGHNVGAELEITDLTGKLVLPFQNIQLGKTSLDIRSLAMGSYLLRIKDPLQTKTLKFVVVR